MPSVFQEFCRDCCDVMPVEILVKDETDALAFIATVYGGVIRTPNGLVGIDNQTLDFSGHVPSEGAILAVVESDDDGVLSIHEGDVFGTPETPSTGDLPAPGPGKHPIKVVSLYESQTLLSNDDIRPVAVLPTDYDALELGHQIHAATEETTLDEDDEFGFWKSDGAVKRKITASNLIAEVLAEVPPVGQYRQFVYVVNGDGSISLVSAGGEAVYILKDLEA